MISPDRLLVIRFSSLGDIVLTAPVTRALRQRFPQTEIVYATKRLYEPLVAQLPGVDRIICFDEKDGIERFIVQIRRERFDLLLDLSANLRSRLVAAFAGSKVTLRYRKRRLARMAMVYGPRHLTESRHTVDLYLDTLKETGIEQADRLPDLAVSDKCRAAVADRLGAHGVGPSQLLIGLAPGASCLPKQWPARYFAAVADHFVWTRQASIVLIGAGDDSAATQAVKTAMATPVIDWTGQCDLSLLPAAIQRCQTLLTNDTGPMHVASAVGTPVVGLFGPTHPCLGFTPLGPHDASLSMDLSCSPCSLHGARPCRFKTNACLETLLVDRVIQEVTRSLDRQAF